MIFRPSTPIILPTNDINLAIERRSRATYGWNTVTTVAHVWFTCFFEGNGPENAATNSGANTAQSGPDLAGVFHISFDAMDGIKGGVRKSARAFERVAVVWTVASDGAGGREEEVRVARHRQQT